MGAGKEANPFRPLRSPKNLLLSSSGTAFDRFEFTAGFQVETASPRSAYEHLRGGGRYGDHVHQDVQLDQSEVEGLQEHSEEDPLHYVPGEAVDENNGVEPGKPESGRTWDSGLQQI